MAQIIVRKLPEAAKERLRKRAERHGRSLEAEIRDILTHVPAAPKATASKKEGLGTALARRLRKYKVTKEDWETFDRNLAELRGNRRIGSGDFDP